MDMATRVQILDETVYISLNANTLGKSLKQIILFPAINKL